ncbi:hypothetical protein ACFSKW_45595 [Nonomuraea mangrovi]|uniref:Uncharacterized protein n=1 Tax=Nonomuraea mangrovi TaxID=2316207 RepID=A0ABW4TAN1_9ACTN
MTWPDDIVGRHTARKAVTLLLDTDTFDSDKVDSIIGDLIRDLR